MGVAGRGGTWGSDMNGVGWRGQVISRGVFTGGEQGEVARLQDSDGQDRGGGRHRVRGRYIAHDSVVVLVPCHKARENKEESSSRLIAARPAAPRRFVVPCVCPRNNCDTTDGTTDCITRRITSHEQG